MNLTLNIPGMVVFALISSGLFASILLLLKRENRIANRYLALLVFFLSLWLFDTFFRMAGVYEQEPKFYFLPIYFSFGFGPLIYVYTLQLTKKEFHFSPRLIFHFLPVWIQFLFYVHLQIKDYSYRREFWLEIHRPYTYDIGLALSFLLLLIYLLGSRKQVVRYRKKIENSFSDVDRITLSWLNKLQLALFILSFFWLFETIARLAWNVYPVTPYSSLTIGFILLLIAIGGILQKDVSRTTEDLSDEILDTKALQEFDEEVDPEEVKRIVSILIKQELFLIPDITLKDFSEHVRLSPRETSRLINRGLDMTFIDFINQYRVARFKELASSKKVEHLSLLGLAYESGFNSKSTFNRVFKKMEGKSPSSFLKES